MDIIERDIYALIASGDGIKARERFQDKIGKREDIDDGSITINVEETEEKCNITVQFSKMDELQNYEMDIDLNEVEVVTDNG